METHNKLTRIAASGGAPLTAAADTRHNQGRDFTQYMTDMAITEALESVLAARAGIDLRHIHVETYHNTVTLSGQVATESEKTQAATLVAERDNADRVINHLGVRSPH